MFSVGKLFDEVQTVHELLLIGDGKHVTGKPILLEIAQDF